MKEIRKKNVDERDEEKLYIKDVDTTEVAY